ncbi:hypothetical protein BgiMline_021685 [Biomphalaria glabrata]|nr:hypothetical protein BgiMline_028270 [Biomphalaria glabrata]
MRAFITLILVAYMAADVSAEGTCSKSCKAVCAINKQVCELTGLLGPLCGAGSGFCTKSCGLNCACIDLCQDQCGAELQKCKSENANGLLSSVTCLGKFNQCAAVCGTQCASNAASGILNQISSLLP